MNWTDLKVGLNIWFGNGNEEAIKLGVNLAFGSLKKNSIDKNASNKNPEPNKSPKDVSNGIDELSGLMCLDHKIFTKLYPKTSRIKTWNLEKKINSRLTCD